MGCAEPYQNEWVISREGGDSLLHQHISVLGCPLKEPNPHQLGKGVGTSKRQRRLSRAWVGCQIAFSALNVAVN